MLGDLIEKEAGGTRRVKEEATLDRDLGGEEQRKWALKAFEATPSEWKEMILRPLTAEEVFGAAKLIRTNSYRPGEFLYYRLLYTANGRLYGKRVTVEAGGKVKEVRYASATEVNWKKATPMVEIRGAMKGRLGEPRTRLENNILTPSPSFPPPVTFISPSRRPHFPLPSPSFPPPDAFDSPSRRLPRLPHSLSPRHTRFPTRHLHFPSHCLSLSPAQSFPPYSLSSPLLTLFPPAHSLPPCSLSFPLFTRFPPPQSLPPCSLSSPLLTLFPPAHSLPPCSLASPLLNLFPPAHSLPPSSFSFPLLTPLVLTPLSPFLTHFPPSRSLTPSARPCFPDSRLYSLCPPLLTLFPPCSLSFPLLTLFPHFSLSCPLHALFPSLPPVAPLRLALVPSQSPSLSPPVALVFPVALPSTPRCPHHHSSLPFSLPISHTCRAPFPTRTYTLAFFLVSSYPLCCFPPSDLLPPSPSLLPPNPFPTPPIPFLAFPLPLPCFPQSPSLLPSSPSQHPPIHFPAHPHPLPCSPPSPSLLPPISFPSSPYHLPCSPLLPLFHPCSLCFTLAPSPSSLLTLFPLAHSLYFCSLCSPLLPLFPSVQSVPCCFFSSSLLIPFTVFPPSLTPIPPNAVTGAQHQIKGWGGMGWGGAEWGGAGRNGMRRIGEMRDGEMRDEEMRDGEVWDGEERAGEERDREVRDEEVRNGEMREGEMRNGEAREGVMNERVCDGRVLLTTHPPTPNAMGRDERVGGMGREAMVKRGNVMGRGVMTTRREGGEKGGRREG
ncbi:unnamed protein product [Closterium sp. NIES-64]|nr:unnamed protein product [Closterium sp. NIES-64]